MLVGAEATTREQALAELAALLDAEDEGGHDVVLHTDDLVTYAAPAVERVDRLRRRVYRRRGQAEWL